MYSLLSDEKIRPAPSAGLKRSQRKQSVSASIQPPELKITERGLKTHSNAASSSGGRWAADRAAATQTR